MVETPNPPVSSAPHPTAELPPQHRRSRPIHDDEDEHPPVEDEEWRLSYMDTITLLVAMFVLLLSLASFDKGRMTEMAEGIREMEAERRGEPMPPREGLEVAKAEPIPAEVGRDLIGNVLPTGVSLSTTATSVTLDISDNVLFGSGSADLASAGAQVLDYLLPVLLKGRFNISVEGHTDDRPIAGGRYPSNWELSAARATGVVRHFIDRGVPAERLRAIGYAETRPLDPADSAEARARNRRVSISLDIRAESR